MYNCFFVSAVANFIFKFYNSRLVNIKCCETVIYRRDFLQKAYLCATVALLLRLKISFSNCLNSRVANIKCCELVTGLFCDYVHRRISGFCETASSPTFFLRSRTQSDGKIMQIRKANEVVSRLRCSRVDPSRATELRKRKRLLAV